MISCGLSDTLFIARIILNRRWRSLVRMSTALALALSGFPYVSGSLKSLRSRPSIYSPTRASRKLSVITVCSSDVSTYPFSVIETAAAASPPVI